MLAVGLLTTVMVVGLGEGVSYSVGVATQLCCGGGATSRRCWGRSKLAFINTPYCWSSFFSVPLLCTQSLQSRSLWLSKPHQSQNIGICLYWKETHWGDDSPTSTLIPRHKGWPMSILTRTRKHLPRQSPIGEASTCLTRPTELPIASAFSLFMCWIGRLCICTQKLTRSNRAFLTASFFSNLDKPSRYLSKDHGPRIRMWSKSYMLHQTKSRPY